MDHACRRISGENNTARSPTTTSSVSAALVRHAVAAFKLRSSRASPMLMRYIHRSSPAKKINTTCIVDTIVKYFHGPRSHWHVTRYFRKVCQIFSTVLPYQRVAESYDVTHCVNSLPGHETEQVSARTQLPSKSLLRRGVFATSYRRLQYTQLARTIPMK